MLARSDRSYFGSALALALVLVTSCTFTRTSVDECARTEDCRGAFGVGRVCNAEGLCEIAPPNPRCTTTFPPDVLTRPESYPGVLLIGSLMDRSVQEAREQAIRLAAMQVNERAGLDGRLFGVVFCDIAEDAKYDSLKRTDAAIASGRYLANVIGAPVIVGPSASTDTLETFKALANEDVVVVSPAATSPELTTAEPGPGTDEAPGRLWRTAPPDTLQGVAIARHLRTAFPTVNSVALIHERGAYGEGLTGIFVDAFQKAGGTVRVLPFGTLGERDAAIVDAGNPASPLVLFFSSQIKDSVAFVVAAAASENYRSTTLFLTDASATAELLSGASGATTVFPNIRGSRPAIPKGPTFELFKTSYNVAYRQDPLALSWVAHSYDAAWMAFYGMARSLRREGHVHGAGIARGFRNLSRGNTEIAVSPANWQGIANALGAGESVNIVGASGPLDYDPVSEETTGLVDIWKISSDNKVFESVETIDPR